MKLNIIAGFLGMFWLAVSNGMPLPLLMEGVKASGFQLGLLSGVRQFAMLAQLPSAFIVDELHRRKTFWAVAVIIQRLLWGVPALLPILLPDRTDLWPLIIIAGLGIGDALGNAGTAPWYSWMADLLPPGRAGRFWGTRQRVLSLSILIASLVFGLLLDAFSSRGFLGFQIVFAAAAIFGVADILVHMAVHEPAPMRRTKGEALWTRLVTPMRNRDFRRLTLAMGIWTAAVTMPGYASGLPGFFNVVYLKESFGVTYAQASMVFIASAIGAILWTPRIGRMIDQRGARRTLLYLMGIGPGFTLAWLFVTPGQWQIPGLGLIPQPILLIGAASLMVGGLYAGVTLCQVRLTQVLTTASGRTVAMGLHWSLVGVIGTVGALAAGWMKDHLSFGHFCLVEGLAPFSYFQVLILIQVALAWGVALPVARKLSISAIEA
ncbi:MAG: MFS transporter [Verrucomicrobiota bacterium]